MNGPAVGLGCSVIALSDVVYMAESAYLSDPHVTVGLVAADGGPLTWPLHTSLLLAKEYAFTGDRISAERAAEIGLANHVCPDGEVLDAALACAAARSPQLPQQAVEATKRVLNLHVERAVLATIDFALGGRERVVRHRRPPRLHHPHPRRQTLTSSVRSGPDPKRTQFVWGRGQNEPGFRRWRGRGRRGCSRRSSAWRGCRP